MPFADQLPGWSETYAAWLTQARVFLEAQQPREAFAGYPWVRPEDTPFFPLAKPLPEVRLAVVTTGGFYVRGAQAPFTAESVEGDATYRVLPEGVTARDLAIAHTHYPHEAALADWNAILPLDHLRAMVAEGRLGGLGPVFSISGYCTDAAELSRVTAEAIAREARCDAMLLVPV